MSLADLLFCPLWCSGVFCDDGKVHTAVAGGGASEALAAGAAAGVATSSAAAAADVSGSGAGSAGAVGVGVGERLTTIAGLTKIVGVIVGM